MSLVLRPERPEDREEILRLTYEAFMTLDYPGRQRLDEHFLLSLLYEGGKGIAPLCFAAILDGRIAGHIFYSETAFTRPDGSKASTLTFGLYPCIRSTSGRASAGRWSAIRWTWPEEYDKAEQDEPGYAAFDAAFQKKHAPGQLIYDEGSPHSC